MILSLPPSMGEETEINCSGSIFFRACVRLVRLYDVGQHRSAVHGVDHLLNMLVDVFVLLSTNVVEACRLDARWAIVGLVPSV